MFLSNGIIPNVIFLDVYEFASTYTHANARVCAHITRKVFDQIFLKFYNISYLNIIVIKIEKIRFCDFKDSVIN